MARLDAVPVLIIWHDAHAEHSWTTLDELDSDPYVVETIGFLLPNAKKEHVVVVQSIGSDDGLDAVLQIPVGMVRQTILLGNPPQGHTVPLP